MSNSAADSIHDLEIVDTSSTSASSSSVREKGCEIVLSGNHSPVSTKVIAAPKYSRYDIFFATYLGRAAGQGKFPGIQNVGVNWTMSTVIASDEEADANGVILFGCGEKNGERARFNPEDRPVTMALVDDLQLRNEKYLSRLIADAEIAWGRGLLPATMLSEILELHPSWGVDNHALMNWLYPAFEVMFAFERMAIDIRPGEPNLIGFFEVWLTGRPTIPLEVAAQMRSQMQASVKSWRENPSELAAITHSFLSCYGLGQESQDRVMVWLTTAFDIMAANQIGFLAECERLKDIQPIEIQAMKFDRSRELKAEPNPTGGSKRPEYPQISKTLKLLIVRDGNKHTQTAARFLGNDLIVVIRKDGGFGMFMNHSTTRGFSLRGAARMLRVLIKARKNEASEAFLDWKALGSDGEYPGTEGLYFDFQGKMILNGSDKELLKIRLNITPDDLKEISRICLHEQEVWKWRLRTRRMYDPRRS